MPVWRAQVQMPRDTGLPEDIVTNTWHFEGADTPAVRLGILDGLDAFYHAIDGYLSPELVGTATILLYNLDLPEPRVPVAVRAMVLTLSSSTPLPAEVAVCLSYQAAPASGTIQRRRRGRIYIGPLGTNAGTNTNPNTPVSSFRGDLAAAAIALVNSSGAANGPWVVYSETGGFTNLVSEGWIDNAWDIQRRRGAAATARTNWAA